MNNICTAPVYKLEELNNIFIELTAKNCNQRCQNCYIDFGTKSLSKFIKDFISVDRIKEALEDTRHENIHCIYLTGAEPMTHPDFNSILRLCLKRCNVCICTNGSFLNEKKIRFLKKVEDEGVNQIFFKLSLAHFDELESDKVKYRGNYRQTFFALKTLSRYNFSSVLSIQNHYKLDKNLILEMFNKIFKEQEIHTTDLQITCSHPDFEDENYSKPSSKTDCMFGRTLSENGIYACPFTSNDYRGRLGSTFKDFSKSIAAETDFCATCSKNNNFMFSIG
ncbi:MAG: radical SAM protein [Candidatus Gastranaerophilales bacterium]|nr:radical SAM protein [Candidatus Gastranaerophilales bacterium]MCM1073157.1 radical SAM protein [Bacteroides sp.]